MGPVAIVCSAHGYGHVTRQTALARALRDEGVSCTLFTAAPVALVAEWLPDPTVVPWTADVGIVQPDSLSEDIENTRVRLEAVCSPARIDALADALSGFTQVIVDTAPPAMEAARLTGVPCVAVGNFDWAWIYSHYPRLRDFAERFARWQAPHLAASLWPGPGLRGFASVVPFGLLARVGQPVLPPSPDQRVLVSFGGFGLDLNALLPVIPGVRYLLAAHGPCLDRPDCSVISDVAYPHLVASADLVLSKPGYGILGEAMAAGTRLLWVPRGAFPEAQSLIDAATSWGAHLSHANPHDLAHDIPAALSRPRPLALAADGARALAQWVVRGAPNPG